MGANALKLTPKACSSNASKLLIFLNYNFSYAIDGQKLALERVAGILTGSKHRLNVKAKVYV